jgi:hypothetical protein
MPNIIFKKTFKYRFLNGRHQKSFSFHGTSVPSTIIIAINQRLAKMPHAKGSSILTFKTNSLNQYCVEMNHSFQKYHEEDAIACVLDVMEEQGWTYKFQYDALTSSTTLFRLTVTSRELFVFHKPCQ